MKKKELLKRIVALEKRYATPEEIALLEQKTKEEILESVKDKVLFQEKIECAKKNLEGVSIPKQKEFVVGNWYYLYWNGGWCLAPFKGKEVESYGFHSDNGWMDDVYWFSIYNINSLEHREATPQEVESALIEEAKRRGFDFEKYQYSETLENEVNEIKLWGHYINPPYKYTEVFKNGKWAEVIEQDKFAELKEAHKNGAVIQLKDSVNDVWDDLNQPAWNPNREYRIKPEEKPKIGDVVKAWDNESEAYTVGKVIKIDSIGYFLQDDLWWDNAKKLTQQEATDLLFNK